MSLAGSLKGLVTLLTAMLLIFSSSASAADKPNIVLIFMDNFGWGEPGF